MQRPTILTDQGHSRRKFIKIAGGTSVVTSFAGCLGGDDDTGGDSGDDDTGGDSGDDDTGGDSGDDDIDFPEEDIRINIPVGPGGGYDFFARLYASYLNDYFDVNVVAENRTGASGMIPTEDVYNGDPTGYELLFFGLQSWVEHHFNEEWLDLTEFTYLPQVRSARRAMLVREDANIDSFEDLAERTRNEELRWGTSNAAGDGHMSVNPALLGELTEQWDTDHIFNNVVVYDSGSATVPAASSGDVDVTGSLALGTALNLADTDNVELFMLYTVGDLPEIAPDDAPTLETRGVTEYADGARIMDAVTDYYPFVTTPGIPEERANILREAITEVGNRDDLQAEIDDADRVSDIASAEDARSRAENIIQVREELAHLFED